MSDDSPLPQQTQSQVTVYGSTQFDMLSKSSGRIYRIFVFRPPFAPPPSGYPVVTVIDANMSFPIAATMAATFMLEGKPALVVGVGYATDDFMQLISLRNRDLTPPTPHSGIRRSPGQPPAKIEDYGGSEDFYRFLVEELRPAIAADYPVNAGDQTLYGHSLGGLFTLGVLFKHPAAFRTFVASSPSIFWNGRSVLAGEAAFEREVRAQEVAPRVLITVGSREEDVPETLLANMTRAQMQQSMREWRMVGNARDLARRLQRVKGGPGYMVQFHAFEDEDHLTALSASLGRALAFALRPPRPRRSWLGLARATSPSFDTGELGASRGGVAVVDGAWNITLNSPIGAQQVVLVLKTDGASLTGTATGGQEPSQEIVNGKVAGGAVSWQLSITQPMSMTLSFSGVVDGDKISGGVKGGVFLSFPFSGERG